jgi:hypothetical protein
MRPTLPESIDAMNRCVLKLRRPFLACRFVHSRERISAMRRLTFSTILTVVLTLGALASTPAFVSAQAVSVQEGRTVIRRPIPLAARNGALDFVRTELFFGTAKPDGVVTDAEFRAFLDQEITPRFPDGLTLLTGSGQFRSDDVIVKENSYLLILLYPVEDAKASNRKIEAIRRRYVTQFAQESVLRVDDPFAVRVWF